MQLKNPILLVIAVGGLVVLLTIVLKSGATESPKRAAEEYDTGVAAKQQTARPIDVADIARSPDDLPPPITRTENELVTVELTTQEVVAEMMPGVTYTYWTYDGTVPGPFIRAMEGDDVEITLNHGTGVHAADDMQVKHFSNVRDARAFLGTRFAHADDGHAHEASATEDDGHEHDDSHSHDSVEAQHEAEGHGTHSIDLHAVVGPGGGATVMQAGHDGPKTFRFKATRPGIYVYHCASEHIPTHIANGMYGMILVEPAGGLDAVEREFYVMQGDFYTKGAYGEQGHQAFDKEKLLSEDPSYFVFNGRVGSMRGENAMRVNAGEKIRMFVGVGSHVASNFHIIGAVFDELYHKGAIEDEPLHNVQTTLIPAGSATMIEFTIDVPGTYLLVDHSLTRAIDKGALAEIVVEGSDRPDLYESLE